MMITPSKNAANVGPLVSRVAGCACTRGYERRTWLAGMPGFLTISMRSGHDSKRLPAGSAGQMLTDWNT